MKDIDTAHRVPSRGDSREQTQRYHFVRRLAREKVMAARRGVSNLNAENLGFSGKVECDISHINLYDHLTSRLQELLFEKNSRMRIQILLGEERISLLAEDVGISQPL